MTWQTIGRGRVRPGQLTAERLISTEHDAQRRGVDQALHGAIAARHEALRV